VSGVLEQISKAYAIAQQLGIPTRNQSFVAREAGRMKRVPKPMSWVREVMSRCARVSARIIAANKQSKIPFNNVWEQRIFPS